LTFRNDNQLNSFEQKLTVSEKSTAKTTTQPKKVITKVKSPDELDNDLFDMIDEKKTTNVTKDFDIDAYISQNSGSKTKGLFDD
jgi:hypothetical protein